MISKENRLSEREVKKVLTRGKPFFSYGIVLNYLKNNLNKNRFAIVIGGKSIKTNVERNYFRRTFYDLVSSSLDNQKGIDYVFVVKKQTKLDKKDEKILNSFKQDINFLLNKV
ncbi:MAG: ribonuclease P protein component [Candidatus Gracilibacteria bacterium]|nr:ribonuclease P protein component [Candidatus Gracilibacteria bacterium]